LKEPFDLDVIGQWSEPRSYRVERAAIVDYALATNEDSAECLSGTVAPPVFALVPAFSTWSAPPLVIAERREEIAGQTVHGEHALVFHRAIRADDELVVRSAMVGVHAKPSGSTSVAKIETRDVHGELVNEQYMTAFYRGVASIAEIGETAPSLASLGPRRDGEPIGSFTYPIDEDQAARYAKAASDFHNIHLDAEFARSVGLPGAILHGMCTLAFATRAVRHATGTDTVEEFRELGCRFSRPICPGDDVTTRVFSLGAKSSVLDVQFECVDRAGDSVLTAGYVRMAQSSRPFASDGRP
jgi:acyl dehydratase